MNQLSRSERAQIIQCLVEGCSLRSTVRMTGFAKKTVQRFQLEIGQACQRFHDRFMRNLPCKDIQLDELWSFTYCKQKNIPATLRHSKGIGDTWTWVAIDRETKLIPCWHVGGRNGGDAYSFTLDLQSRLKHRIQLTSDAHSAYPSAVERAFGTDVDYAQLVKIYGPAPEGPEIRYSTPEWLGSKKTVVTGDPDRRKISTSHVERQNLTVRMSSRRFTRLTNGFSKKLANHKAAVALHMVHYNFARVHMTLRCTPAMEAGIADHVWSMEDLAALMEA
ncbi:MAG: IS1 family transposase [Verrucomicrobia bacterium]|nr:IS1 family transposase [Verrucomicrobiota bacterium]